MELLHSNIQWSVSLDLIGNGLSYLNAKASNMTMDDMWDSEAQFFLTWVEAQARFNISPTEVGDLLRLTVKDKLNGANFSKVT